MTKAISAYGLPKPMNRFAMLTGNSQKIRRCWISSRSQQDAKRTERVVTRTRRLVSPLHSHRPGELGYKESMERFRAGIEAIKKNNAVARWKAGSAGLKNGDDKPLNHDTKQSRLSR